MASNIIDPRTGQPFQNEITQKVQVGDAKIGGLHSRFDEHPSTGLTPRKLASIMKQAEQHQLTSQAELAMDMEEKDGHLFAELQKRKLALTTVEWQIKPPLNANQVEVKAAEMLSEMLANLDVSDVILNMADGVLKGYSAQTIEWQLVDGKQMPVAIEHIPASRFTTSQTNRNVLQLLNDIGQGDDLWPGGWIVHYHKSKSSCIGRAGLVRTLAWPYLFKNYSLRDLAEFLEIYGLPLRLGKYPTGATPDEKSRLLQAVIEVGHNAAGIIPESMAIDFKEAAKGQADPFLALMTWAEKTMSKAILGATLTSQADGASSTNALGNVHNEVRHDIRNADLRQIANTLTRDLLWPMVAFNVQGITNFYRCPKFEFNTAEAGDIKLLAESLPGLQQSGMKISRKWLHESTQIPVPESDEDTLSAIAPVQQAQLTQKSGCRCGGCASVVALKSNAKQSQTPQEQVASLLASELDPEITRRIDEIKALVEQAESFDQLQETLLGWADGDVGQMAEVMGQALVLAELQGRSDLLDEALNVE